MCPGVVPKKKSEPVTIDMSQSWYSGLTIRDRIMKTIIKEAVREYRDWKKVSVSAEEWTCLLERQLDPKDQIIIDTPPSIQIIGPCGVFDVVADLTLKDYEIKLLEIR